MEEDTRTPDDFMVSKLLGEDNESTVVLARDVKTEVEYAIKILEKNRIQKEDKWEQVEREKEMISKLDHPFFVKLKYSFSDEKRLYFVLTYAGKGDLLSYIEQYGRLSRPCVQHYAAELLLALEYLRNLHIIHRDLKPENILLTEEMHIQITDFGTAREISDEDDLGKLKRKTSFVGTANYVPPELLVDKASNIDSDLWSYGCIVYQMITGKLPFYESEDFRTFQRIIQIDYKLADFVDDEARDLIAKLLIFEPEKRLGSEQSGGFNALKSHPFFRGINWEDLPTKTPPIMDRPLSRLSVHTSSSGSTSDNREARISPTKGGTMRRSAKPSRHDEEKKKLPTSDPYDVEGYGLPPGLVGNERERWMTKQENSTWHHFSDGALILKSAELEKKRKLTVKTRQFLLLEGPKLIYIDCDGMELKGEIPWSLELRTQVKTFKEFQIHVPGRSYNMIDKKGNAIKWCRKIEEIKQYYQERNGLK